MLLVLVVVLEPIEMHNGGQEGMLVKIVVGILLVLLMEPCI